MGVRIDRYLLPSYLLRRGYPSLWSETSMVVVAEGGCSRFDRRRGVGIGGWGFAFSANGFSSFWLFYIFIFSFFYFFSLIWGKTVTHCPVKVSNVHRRFNIWLRVQIGWFPFWIEQGDLFIIFFRYSNFSKIEDLVVECKIKLPIETPRRLFKAISFFIQVYITRCAT